MFRRDEKVKVMVKGPGWMKGEKLAIARDRVLTVVDAGGIPVGKEIAVRIERVVDGYIWRENESQSHLSQALLALNKKCGCG